MGRGPGEAGIYWQLSRKLSRFFLSFGTGNFRKNFRESYVNPKPRVIGTSAGNYPSTVVTGLVCV